MRPSRQYAVASTWCTPFSYDCPTAAAAGWACSTTGAVATTETVAATARLHRRFQRSRLAFGDATRWRGPGIPSPPPERGPLTCDRCDQPLVRAKALRHQAVRAKEKR